jgi:hypothetical protein
MTNILKNDINTFFEVPFVVRGEKSAFASTFKPDLKQMLSTQNPIFKSENDFVYYTFIQKNKPVGRISVHLHHDFNARYGTKKCYFGFFECINDQNIANQLFALAEIFAKSHGCTTLAGNFNLTAMQEMGVMVAGFEHEPYVLQSYSMPYYQDLMTNAGFSPTFPMATYEIDVTKSDPNAILTPKQKAILLDSDFEFVPITRAMYPKIKADILAIFNKGFDQNALFVPISMEEFDFQAKDLVYFMDSHISFLAKHKGTPIGVSIHVPDINPLLRATGSKLSWNMVYHFIKSKIQRDRALCIFSALLPEYQKQGVLGVILHLTLAAMKKRGYKTFGITWISDSNKGSLRKIEDSKARKLHELRIFEKHIEN